MTDRERAIKYRKEARRYKRKYGEVIQAVRNIRAEIQKLADDEWNKQVGSVSQGLEDAIEIIDEHLEDNDGKTIQ